MIADWTHLLNTFVRNADGSVYLIPEEILPDIGASEQVDSWPEKMNHLKESLKNAVSIIIELVNSDEFKPDQLMIILAITTLILSLALVIFYTRKTSVRLNGINNSEEKGIDLIEEHQNVERITQNPQEEEILFQDSEAFEEKAFRYQKDLRRKNQNLTRKLIEIYKSTSIDTDKLILHLILGGSIFLDFCKYLFKTIYNTNNVYNKISPTELTNIEKLISHRKLSINGMNGSHQNNKTNKNLIWQTESKKQLTGEGLDQLEKKALMKLTNKELREKLQGKQGISRLRKSELVDLLLKSN